MTILSALLAHDQVVSPQKIDEAIQRQVIFGGDFETNLLEVGAVGEDTLAAYCAAVHDLPPATREEVLAADPVAIARLPRDLAARHEVVPLRAEHGWLVVASRGALDAAARAAIEAAAALPLDIRVAIPPRLAWALWRFYQVPLAPRLGRLTERLRALAPGELRPVTRPPSLPLTGPPGGTSVAPGIASTALAALGLAIEDDDDGLPSPEPGERQSGRPTPIISPPPALLAESRWPPALPGGTEPSAPPAPEAKAEPLSADVPPGVTGGVARGVSLDEARRLLAAAHDRDAVIAVLLDHVIERFVYVALFVVHGDACAGVAARGQGASTDVVHGLAVPLESRSAFSLARETGEVAIAGSGVGDTDAFVREDLGRREARDAVVVPIRIGGRVAILLWADTDAVPPPDPLVLDLVDFCAECSAAFTRLILERRKAAGTPAAQRRGRTAAAAQRPSPPPRASRPPRESRLQALRRAIGTAPPPTPAPPAPPPKAPSVPPPKAPSVPPPGAPVGGTARVVHAYSVPPRPMSPPPSEIDQQVLEIARTGTLPDEAVEALVAKGPPALQAVFRYFPGPHTIDREQVRAELPAMAESGPILRLAVAFGVAAVPHLLAGLDDPDPDARFCALLCLGELVDPRAIERLVPRLLDPEYPTRMAAIEVLKRYRLFPEFDAAGHGLRALVQDAHAPAERRRIAAHALGELRDPSAVEALVATLGDFDCALAGAAHRALVVLTRQDFGTDTARWREWLRGAGARHRIEWLIDALLHPEPTLRHDASEELKKLTEQFFGYYFNLPRRERERAHQRYVEWWQREGAARFGRVGT